MAGYKYREPKNKMLTFSTKITFGKYSGRSLFEIMRMDKSYFSWVVSIWKSDVDWKVLKVDIEYKEELKKEYDMKSRGNI